MVGNFYQFVEWSYVVVYVEYVVGDDEFQVFVGIFVQYLVEVGGVGVFVDFFGCFCQLQFVDDVGVVEFVVYYEVVFVQQVVEYFLVGGKVVVQYQCVVGVFEVCKLVFKVFVNLQCFGDGLYCFGVYVLLLEVLCGVFFEVGVVGKIQIIVVCQVYDFVFVYLCVGLLWCVENMW